MTRYPGLTLRIIGSDAAAMGPGKAELIERIAETGSISAAARAMGMSYRRAWMLVAALNVSFIEPVIVAETGGRHGGGARVTKFGTQLVDEYRAMEDSASAAITSKVRAFEKHLRQPRSRRPRSK